MILMPHTSNVTWPCDLKPVWSLGGMPGVLLKFFQTFEPNLQDCPKHPWKKKHPKRLKQKKAVNNEVAKYVLKSQGWPPVWLEWKHGPRKFSVGSAFGRPLKVGSPSYLPSLAPWHGNPGVWAYMAMLAMASSVPCRVPGNLVCHADRWRLRRLRKKRYLEQFFWDKEGLYQKITWYIINL